MYYVEKAASENDFQRQSIGFRRARDAFKAYLQAVDLKKGEKILLPSYIGWSSREGSGVFDPVAELGIEYEFYRMDEFLNVDIQSLKSAFEKNNVRAFLLIHYFGYTDPYYREIIDIAKQNNALIVEDEAHSMLTDLIGGISGRAGDVSIFSLHKMLPVKDGGMLVFNNNKDKFMSKAQVGCSDIIFPWIYDLKAISEKRIANAKLLEKKLKNFDGFMTPLRREVIDGTVPQTYPVLMKNFSSDKLNLALNDKGFGTVRLYYHIIDKISQSDFPSSHKVSANILNFPIHQGVYDILMDKMLDAVSEILNASDI